MRMSSRLLVYARGVLAGLVVGLPVGTTFADTVGYPAPVVGVSMRPTLNPSSQSRDVAWVDRWSLRRRRVRRGDVVVLHSPTHPGDVLVKRVVAVEGMEVETKGFRSRHVMVPPGHCWVEGDNQRSSRDSNIFGAVSYTMIFGRGSHIVWPPTRWRRLKTELLLEQKRRSHDNQHEVI